MKKIILLTTCFLTIFAQTLQVNHFSTDIFSSVSKELKKVDLSLMIEGRYVEDEKYKVIDALNVVIGSFYVETLATSQGKESLKKLLKEYSAKKHDVDIDDVYILNFQVDEGKTSFSLDELVKRLEQEGCCEKTPFKKSVLTPLIKPGK